VVGVASHPGLSGVLAVARKILSKMVEHPHGRARISDAAMADNPNSDLQRSSVIVQPSTLLHDAILRLRKSRMSGTISSALSSSRKMPCVDQVKLDVGQIALVRVSAVSREDLVVLAPDDQRRWLVLAEIGLHLRGRLVR
jgi:hypothetical protein